MGERDYFYQHHFKCTESKTTWNVSVPSYLRDRNVGLCRSYRREKVDIRDATINLQSKWWFVCHLPRSLGSNTRTHWLPVGWITHPRPLTWRFSMMETLLRLPQSGALHRHPRMILPFSWMSETPLWVGAALGHVNSIIEMHVFILLLADELYYTFICTLRQSRLKLVQIWKSKVYL